MGEDDGTFYQIVCACGPVPWIQAQSWLAQQIGYEFEDGFGVGGSTEPRQ